MVDTYNEYQGGLSAPYLKAFAVAPHNTNEFAIVPRALYVGGSGDVVVVLRDDTVAVTLKAVPVGILNVRAKVVKATGTLATNIIGLY